MSPSPAFPHAPLTSGASRFHSRGCLFPHYCAYSTQAETDGDSKDLVLQQGQWGTAGCCLFQCVQRTYERCSSWHNAIHSLHHRAMTRLVSAHSDSGKQGRCSESASQPTKFRSWHTRDAMDPFRPPVGRAPSSRRRRYQLRDTGATASTPCRRRAGARRAP